MKCFEVKKNRKKVAFSLVVAGSTINLIVNSLSNHIVIPDFVKGFFEGFSLSIAGLGFIVLIVTTIAQRRNPASVN